VASHRLCPLGPYRNVFLLFQRPVLLSFVLYLYFSVLLLFISQIVCLCFVMIGVPAATALLREAKDLKPM
jgi:hypothetical protein